jgi:hypothetical protein
MSAGIVTPSLSRFGFYLLQGLMMTEHGQPEFARRDRATQRPGPNARTRSSSVAIVNCSPTAGPILHLDAFFLGH